MLVTDGLTEKHRYRYKPRGSVNKNATKIAQSTIEIKQKVNCYYTYVLFIRCCWSNIQLQARNQVLAFLKFARVITYTLGNAPGAWALGL